MDAQKRSVVIVGSKQSVFVSRTADQLREQSFSVTILDPTSKGEIAGSRLIKIGQLVSRVIRTIQAILPMNRNSSVIIMFLSGDLFWLGCVLKLKFKRIIGLAFGSDILRRNRSRDKRFSFGLRQLDVVAATNDNVMAAILDEFPSVANKEHKVIKFGLPVFDELNILIKDEITSSECRQLLGYNPEKFLISLGYSSSEGQRQIELIDAFSQAASFLSQCDFVVPVQYGSPMVANSVEAACKRANKKLKETRFYVLREFHDPAKSALMRVATDVLINHSVSDAFSGSVQEVVYAGNLVLAVDHLPYKNMPGYGTAIRSYTCLSDAIESLKPNKLYSWKKMAKQKLTLNRTALHATSSWEAVMPAWRELIGGNEDNF